MLVMEDSMLYSSGSSSILLMQHSSSSYDSDGGTSSSVGNGFLSVGSSDDGGGAVVMKMVWVGDDSGGAKAATIAHLWKEFKKLLMEEYCPNDEIQKLELEFWNYKMVGSDIDGYTTRFHEWASMANRLTTDGINDGIFKKKENVGDKKRSNNQVKNQGRNVRNKRDMTGRNFVVTAPDQGQVQHHYAGQHPKCAKCNFHHSGNHLYVLKVDAFTKRIDHLEGTKTICHTHAADHLLTINLRHSSRHTRRHSLFAISFMPWPSVVYMGIHPFSLPSRAMLNGLKFKNTWIRPELTTADRADIVDRVFEQKVRDYISAIYNRVPETWAPTLPFIAMDGFVHYSRRDTNISTQRQEVWLDNAYVVPFNRALCMRFYAHINVEYCGWTMLIKYLFKYISKGTDRVVANIATPIGAS
nr:DNA helicase [Tanacetum cinerariifolium]